jgi:hypothetical protein
LAEILPKSCKIEYLLAKKTDYPSKGWEFFTGDWIQARRQRAGGDENFRRSHSRHRIGTLPISLTQIFRLDRRAI